MTTPTSSIAVTAGSGENVATVTLSDGKKCQVVMVADDSGWGGRYRRQPSA